MIDGNQLREEFGRYLAEHKATRWGMDAALMHVCKIAYDAGKADGRVEPECMLAAAAPAPADVPMPQSYAERPTDYTGGVWIESQMRTYGDAREAAGYERGLKSRVPLDAINKMLADCMDVAVANGANSVSMPDHYVEVAAWVCGNKDAAPTSAEAPMPEPDTHCYDDDEQHDVWSHSADQMRTYGERCRAAGEAAGYARGLKEAERDAERLDWILDRVGVDHRGVFMTVGNAGKPNKGASVKAIDAALRGEVK